MKGEDLMKTELPKDDIIWLKTLYLLYGTTEFSWDIIIDKKG